MNRVIAIANQKGGVGKTTTAINLSACLADLGKKVLALDLDPQGNMTSGLGVDKDEIESSVYDLLIGNAGIEECICENVLDNLDVLPSNIDLSAAEIEMIGVDNKEFIIKKEMEKIKDKWQEITHQQEYAKNITILTGEFGADAIERLLSGGLLEQWKNSYISILSAIDMETQGYIGEMTKQLAELYKGTFDETGARIAVPSASPSREESGNPPSGAAMISGDSVLTPLQPGDEMYGMMQKWNAYMDSINGNIEKLIPHSVNDHNRQMSEVARRISNVSNVFNNNRNMQPVVQNITLNCPNVTDHSGVDYLKRELLGLSLRAYQEPLKAY